MSIKYLYYRVPYIFILMLIGIVSPAQNLEDNDYQDLRESVIKQLPNTLQRINTLLNNDKMTPLDKASLHYLKGLAFFYANEYDQSEAYYDLSLAYFEASDSSKRALTVLLSLSNLYSDQFQFTKAASCLYKAKAMNDKMNDPSFEAKIATFFAHINYKQGNLSGALAHLESAVENYQAINDSIALANLYNNIAILYKNKKQYNKAVDYNSKSLEISMALNDRLMTASSYNNIAVNYEELYIQSDSVLYLNQALAFYSLSAQITRDFPDKWNTGLENIARIYSMVGQEKKADFYYKELLGNSKNKNEYERLGKLFKKEMLYAFQKNNLKRAQQYYTRLDSVQNLLQDVQLQDFEKMLENQRELYEAKKTEKEKELKFIDEKHKRLLAEKENEHIKFILLGLVLTTVIVFLIVIQYFKDQRFRNEQEKNKLRNKVLRSQMNPHFIFNVLTAIQNTLLDNDPLKTSTYIARFSRLIRQNFYFTSRDFISLEEEVDSLRNYIETQKVRFGDKFDYQIDVDESIDVSKEVIPPMLMQPIVENAIEHGLKNKKENGVLEISIGMESKQMKFMVKDNGSGYKISNKDNKEHSMDVLKSRLKLPGFGDEETLKIFPLDDPKGTQVEFLLTIN